jgi:ankyrin repeat protein
MGLIGAVCVFVLLAACGKHESNSWGRVGTGDEFRGKTDKVLEAIDADDTLKLEKLLADGVSVNATLPDGETLLIRAAKNGYARVVNLLVRRGADLKRMDSDNKTAADHARANGQTRALMLLDAEEHTKARAELIHAILNEEGRVNKLLKDGVNPNFLDMQNSGESPLTLAIENARERSSKIIAKWKDSLEITSTDVNFANQSGVRPLAKARLKNQAPIVTLLESLGAKD